MQWKIRMMSGTEYTISEAQAQAARAAMKGGGILDLGVVLINAKSIESIEDLEKAKDLSNPILIDENFKKWVDGDSRSIDLLNNRYPLPKYKEAWDQALVRKEGLEFSKQLALQ